MIGPVEGDQGQAIFKLIVKGLERHVRLLLLEIMNHE
jgi:hypothetical protein